MPDPRAASQSSAAFAATQASFASARAGNGFGGASRQPRTSSLAEQERVRSAAGVTSGNFGSGFDSASRVSEHSLMDVLGRKVSRAFLLNLTTQAKVEFLFNPNSISDKHQPNYARHSSQGLSHQRLQYVGSENVKIDNVTIILDQLVFNERRASSKGRPRAVGVAANNDVDEKRRLLIQMTLPRRGNRLAQIAPTPVLFFWPGLYNMRMRVMSAEFSHVEFEVGSSIPRLTIAKVSLEEEPLERLYAEDALRQGTWRPWGATQQRGA